MCVCVCGRGRERVVMWLLIICPLIEIGFMGVVPGGAGAAMAPTDFGRSVNPISTKGA